MCLDILCVGYFVFGYFESRPSQDPKADGREPQNTKQMRPTNREDDECQSGGAKHNQLRFSMCGTHVFRVLGLPAVGLGVVSGGGPRYRSAGGP